MKDLKERTLGELAGMRDTLCVAKQVLPVIGSEPERDLTIALGLVIGVLEAIVNGTPHSCPPWVRERVAYKPRKATKR